MSSSNLPESGRHTPPPVSPAKSAPTKSPPVGKLSPYLIQHKRVQLQAFDGKIQELELLSRKEFLNCLGFKDAQLPSSIPPELCRSLSIDKFVDLANHIAESIRAKRFPNRDLLKFRDTENNTRYGHVTGTSCRPDITAAFEKDWIENEKGKFHSDWALMRLAGEKVSKGKSFDTQKKNAATYLHYLLLARPDLLVAQGLLTFPRGVMFLVGIGGVGIRQLEFMWEDQELYKFLYALIYRLYEPSNFVDPSYIGSEFNKETSEVTYTIRIEGRDCDFRPIYARNPFTTRTHVLSNPSLVLERPEGAFMVLKEQLCRTGRPFDEWMILAKIHQLRRVPGVVEVVHYDVIRAPLSPERSKYRLGLRQTGSPFRSIPTAKNMLETLFDLLEVLRCLRFERRILHRDVSIGNVMYIKNPEIPKQDQRRVEMEPLVFAKYLLEESECPRATSLLLVDFNVGEDLDDKQEKRSKRIGTPLFVSRAVERGGPVPLRRACFVPKTPKSPECYARNHLDRIKDFPEEIKKEFIKPSKLNQLNQSQDNEWRHELDHDVESVFWLLLYWATVAQPKGCRGEDISACIWTNLIEDFDSRNHLVWWLSSGDPPNNLMHSAYEPLWPLIKSLADTLVVDRHWLPKSDVRNHPGYSCEAFQRLILQFIITNRDESFMTLHVDDSLRTVQGVPKSEALTTTPSEAMDVSKREELIGNTGTKPFALYRTEDDNVSSSMSE